jgi:hypothetical protein
MADFCETDMRNDSYRTSELELASFLKAEGHKLLRAELKGKLVEFQFDASAENAVDDYFAGASLSARDLFEAHRSLRALIVQIHEHTSNRRRTEQSNGKGYTR